MAVDSFARQQALTPSSGGTAGETLFLRSKNLEDRLGFARIHLKFEGGNPTGTQKDRIARELVEESRRQGCAGITAGTCGNLGLAIASAARPRRIRTVLYIPQKYRVRRAVLMRRAGAEIRFVPGEYEDAVETSRSIAAKEGLYDANPGDGTREISLRAYAPIADEIVRVLCTAPTCVAIPVGNGTTFAGIAHGFQVLLQQRAIESRPRLIAASTAGGNPIVTSHKAGRSSVEDLPRESILESPVNDPLVSFHAYDGQAALDALRATDGFAESVSDRQLHDAARLIRGCEGIDVLPASAAALVAMRQVWHDHLDGLSGEFVVVLTGRRL